MRAPTLFISHGSPMLAIEPSPARDFLIDYGKQLAKPRAIVIVSAHFGTSRPAVVGDAKPGMIYDFRGFPDALSRIVYPAPGDPVAATKVAGLLQAAGLAPAIVSNRGFDHGTWVPLSLLFPDADVPVVQLALQPQLGPAHHVALGRALESLKHEGIMVIGSGNAGHNLEAFFQGGFDGPDSDRGPDWVMQFDEWIRDKVQAGAVEELIQYRDRAPFARENHPTDEHLLPLHVAVGAAGGAKGELIHSSYAKGMLSMDAYVFH